MATRQELKQWLNHNSATEVVEMYAKKYKISMEEAFKKLKKIKEDGK